MAPIRPAFINSVPIAARRTRKPMCCTTPPSSSAPVSVNVSDSSSEAQPTAKFQVGQRVRVISSVTMYHVPQHRNEPVEMKGKEGTIIKDVSYKDGVEMSATAPYVVKFEASRRFQAHFTEDEIEAI